MIQFDLAVKWARVIIYINVVELESPMLHDKFIIHVGLPVLEKKMFKGFYHIWAWRPSWPCDVMHDLDYLYKLSFPSKEGST